MKLQAAFDRTVTELRKKHSSQALLWKKEYRAKWANQKATASQRQLLEKLCPSSGDFSLLTKGDASILINHLLYRKKGEDD